MGELYVGRTTSPKPDKPDRPSDGQRSHACLQPPPPPPQATRRQPPPPPLQPVTGSPPSLKFSDRQPPKAAVR